MTKDSKATFGTIVRNGNKRWETRDDEWLIANAKLEGNSWNWIHLCSGLARTKCSISMRISKLQRKGRMTSAHTRFYEAKRAGVNTNLPARKVATNQSLIKETSSQFSTVHVDISNSSDTAVQALVLAILKAGFPVSLS